MNKALEELRNRAHMRFESPEPESRQGRRNDRTAGVQLLDADGGISLEVSGTGYFERVTGLTISRIVGSVLGPHIRQVLHASP